MFTIALLSRHKPSLKYTIMSQSCSHGVAAHRAWHQLTPVALIPVWMAGTGGTAGLEQGRASALDRLTAGIPLPCGSQSLHRDLNNHSKVTTLSLAHAWRATILTLCSLCGVPHTEPITALFSEHTLGPGSCCEALSLFACHSV